MDNRWVFRSILLLLGVALIGLYFIIPQQIIYLFAGLIIGLMTINNNTTNKKTLKCNQENDLDLVDLVETVKDISTQKLSVAEIRQQLEISIPSNHPGFESILNTLTKTKIEVNNNESPQIELPDDISQTLSNNGIDDRAIDTIRKQTIKAVQGDSEELMNNVKNILGENNPMINIINKTLENARSKNGFEE